MVREALRKESKEPKTAEEASMTRPVKAIHAIRRGVSHYDDEVSWEGQLYRPGVELDLVRARLVTESFKQTDGLPWVIRRAKAFAHYLKNVPLNISPGQKFVGGGTSACNYVPFVPEKYTAWVRRALHDEAMKAMFSKEALAEVDEILDWWQGKTVWSRMKESIPDWLERYRQFDGTFQWAQYDQGPIQSEWQSFKGIKARIEDAEKKLEELERTLPPDYVHQKTNVEAMLITLKAGLVYVQRWADYCRKRATQEKGPKRRTELEEMAKVCDRVPANPPRDFREALQHVEMIGSMNGREEAGYEGTPFDRFDVLFGPYWEKSKAEGMTREEGVELIKWYLLKLSEASALQTPLIAQSYSGQQRGIMLAIGGVDKDGKDVTNDLTYMLMDAYLSMKLNEPQLNLRIHPGTPKAVIMKALDMLSHGLTYPSFFNDNALIPWGLKHGLSMENARTYLMRFCVLVKVANRSYANNAFVGWMNWAKVFSWAMRKGIDPDTGEQKGAATKDPLQWTGYEDMMEAYLDQLRFFSERQAQMHRIGQQVVYPWMAKPWCSAWFVDSLERGLIAQEWEADQSITGDWPIVGPTNVANSMAAIKKWVFDDKKVKMADLIEALCKNWEGYEDLRQLMLSAPKFGNDDDYVDLIAKDVHVKSTALMESFRDHWGKPLVVNGSNAATIFAFSWDTEATPDGRYRGSMLADGTVSPAEGTDRKGPTAILRSASKIPVPETYSHLLNLKLSPEVVEGDVGRETFHSLIKTWMEMGISHIQFNILKKKTLLDAQAHPKKHPDLLVRVAGYSAYFIDLSKGMQDHIIARTEYHSW